MELLLTHVWFVLRHAKDGGDESCRMYSLQSF